MISALKNAYYNWKYSKQLISVAPDFNVNIEVPTQESLIADITQASPKPLILVVSNLLAEEMVKDDLLPLMAMDHSSLHAKLRTIKKVWIPAGLLNEEILGMPDLNVVTLCGSSSWGDMTKEVQGRILELGQELRLSIIGDNADAIFAKVTPHIAEQIWDMDQVMECCKAFAEEKINGEITNKIFAAKRAAQRVRYLVKGRDVRTVRANLKLVWNGFQVTLL